VTRNLKPGGSGNHIMADSDSLTGLSAASQATKAAQSAFSGGSSAALKPQGVGSDLETSPDRKVAKEQGRRNISGEGTRERWKGLLQCANSAWLAAAESVRSPLGSRCPGVRSLLVPHTYTDSLRRQQACPEVGSAGAGGGRLLARRIAAESVDVPCIKHIQSE
jgi:hypothetical protein